MTRIPLGGGAYLEPDSGPRDSPFHRRIMKTDPIPHTRHGHWLTLDCGHRPMAFGNVDYAGGVALCVQCRDEAMPWN